MSDIESNRKFAPGDEARQLRQDSDRLDGQNRSLLAEKNKMQAERDSLQVQRDQVLHLLSGGTLTEQQVAESGLGHGVLSEQNHHEAMRCKAEKERDEARAALQQAQAEAAAMREALEKWKTYWQTCETGPTTNPEQAGEDFTNAWFEMESALATDSGKAIIKRLEEARWIIKHALDSDFYCGRPWMNHRDAWLNPKEGKL